MTNKIVYIRLLKDDPDDQDNDLATTYFKAVAPRGLDFPGSVRCML